MQQAASQHCISFCSAPQPVAATALPAIPNLQVDGVDGFRPTAAQCARVVLSSNHPRKRSRPIQTSTIDLDFAKNVLQMHGVDAVDRVALCQKVRRDRPVKLFGSFNPCLVGMEAFATTHSLFRPKAARAVRMVMSLYDTAFCAALSTPDAAFL